MTTVTTYRYTCTRCGRYSDDKAFSTCPHCYLPTKRERAAEPTGFEHIGEVRETRADAPVNAPRRDRQGATIGRDGQKGSVQWD
jgi:ribosomal protein L37E